MMICRRTLVLPVEVIVRGYLAGSGWKDYRRTGAICGIRLPPGLVESDRLPRADLHPVDEGRVRRPRREHRSRRDDRPARTARARWPPARTAAAGELAEQVRDAALTVYGFGARIAADAGILLADTKFEFGLTADRRAAPDRRGAHARFVALLGRRRLRARAGPRRATTSSTSATGSRPSPGTRRRPARSCRPRSSPAPAPATSRPSSGSPARASTAISRRTSSADERRRRHSGSRSTSRPSPGILDPQGRAVEGSLPHLGIDGVSARPGRPAGRADRRRARPRPTARATVDRLAGELLSNPLIEAYRSSSSARRRRRPRPTPSTGSRADGPDRRRRLPGLEPRHRRARTPCGWPAPSRSSCGTSRADLDGGRRDRPARAASPTATTSAPGSSPGSARSCARWPAFAGGRRARSSGSATASRS